MTPAQRTLHEKHLWYSNAQYDGCSVDWLGSPLKTQTDTLAKALVPKNNGVPPGFRSMGVPFSERRPVAPIKLVRRTVNRFTAQLFGDQMHPIIRVLGDEDTQHWASSFASTARLWAMAQQARNLGGAQGTVAMGWKVIDRVPIVEVFDLRYCRPIWKNREQLELQALDQRYEVPVYITPEKGPPYTAWYWIRRLISDEADIRYKPVFKTENHPAMIVDGQRIEKGPARGEEPDWRSLIDLENSAKNLGECPVVWGQNLPVLGSEYGEADCEDLYPQVADIDQIRSSITTAVKANQDPTLVIESTETTPKFPPDLKKGSGNGIALGAGSKAHYLEMSGSGTTVAMSWYDRCREDFDNDAECVSGFGKDGSPPQTAFEVAARLGPQNDKTSRLREQYGQQLIRRLLEKVIRAAPKLDIQLEPRVVGREAGKDIVEEVKLGSGGYVRVDWPPIIRPTPADTSAASAAVAAAVKAGGIDKEAAAAYLGPYYGIDDVEEMVARIKKTDEALMKMGPKPGQLPATPPGGSDGE